MKYEIEIEPFGAFRNYLPNGAIKLNLAANADIMAIKAALKAYIIENIGTFDDEKLLTESAIASEDEILGANFTLCQNLKLAILPPVCGG